MIAILAFTHGVRKREHVKAMADNKVLVFGDIGVC